MIFRLRCLAVDDAHGCFPFIKNDPWAGTPQQRAPNRGQRGMVRAGLARASGGHKPDAQWPTARSDGYVACEHSIKRHQRHKQAAANTNCRDFPTFRRLVCRTARNPEY